MAARARLEATDLNPYPVERTARIAELPDERLAGGGGGGGEISLSRNWPIAPDRYLANLKPR